MNTSYHPTVSARTEKWIRLSAIAMMLLVAIAAVVLSFDGLRTLAVSNRVPEHLAFLFPIIIDGTITMSSLAILRMNLGGQKATFGWLVMFFGVGLSIAGNAISVQDSGVVAMFVHALPPILLAISLELLLSLIRANIKAFRESALSEEPKTSSEPVEEFEAVDHEGRVEKIDPVRNAIPVESAPVKSMPVSAPEAEMVENEDAVVPEPDAPSSMEFGSRPVEESVARSTGSTAVTAEEDAPTTPAVVSAPAFPDASLAAQLEELAEADEERQIAESFDQTLRVEEDAVEHADQDIREADTASPEGPSGEEALRDEQSTLTEGDTLVASGEDLVAQYRKLVEGHDDWVRAKKIFMILMKYPEAQVNDIKRALGDKGNVSYKDDLAMARKNVEKARKKRVGA